MIYPDAQPGSPAAARRDPPPRQGPGARPCSESPECPAAATAGANARPVPQGVVAMAPEGNPAQAPAAGVPAGYYGPLGAVTPVRFDERPGQDAYPTGGRADFQSAQGPDGAQLRPTGPAPWTNNAAAQRDPRQFPGQEPPAANPLRSDYP